MRSNDIHSSPFSITKASPPAALVLNFSKSLQALPSIFRDMPGVCSSGFTAGITGLERGAMGCECKWHTSQQCSPLTSWAERALASRTREGEGDRDRESACRRERRHSYVRSVWLKITEEEKVLFWNLYIVGKESTYLSIAALATPSNDSMASKSEHHMYYLETAVMVDACSHPWTLFSRQYYTRALAWNCGS